MLGIFLKSPRKRLVAFVLFGALLAGGLALLVAQA
jgi:hypothetical protein